MTWTTAELASGTSNGRVLALKSNRLASVPLSWMSETLSTAVPGLLMVPGGRAAAAGTWGSANASALGAMATAGITPLASRVRAALAGPPQPAPAGMLVITLRVSDLAPTLVGLAVTRRLTVWPGPSEQLV